MIRGLFRLVLVVVVLCVAAVFLLGWWPEPLERAREAVGTSGATTDRAREVGAKVGEKTAVAAAEVGQKTAAVADQARRALATGSLTAKIKAKMALDDSVKALNIDVDTAQGGIVTVSGTVSSEAQRTRALALARETDGVTQVIDKLVIR